MIRLARTAAALATVLAVSTATLGQESKPEAAAPSAAVAGDALTLKPRFVKDAVHRFEYKIERTDTAALGGAAPATVPPSTVTADAVITLTVKDVSDAGASLEFKIESLKATAKIPAGESAFDSSKPEDDKDRDNPAFQAFKPLVGMVLTLSVDPSGVVTAASGEPAVPQGPAATFAAQFFTNIDYIKFRWSNALSARRDGGPAKVGDSWSHTDVFIASNVGRFEQEIRHTLKSVKDGAASVDSAGDMKLFPLKEGAQLGFELKNANILGTAIWDTADGLVRSLEMQRAFTLDGAAQGLPVKRDSQEKLSITRAR